MWQPEERKTQFWRNLWGRSWVVLYEMYLHNSWRYRSETIHFEEYCSPNATSQFIQIWVGLKITYWFLMGDNGYGQMNPLSAMSFGLPAKDIWNAEDIQKHSAQRDRHPGVNWQTYNVLILHWTFICLAVGCYWERPAWTPWTRLKVKQVNMQPKVLRFTFLFCYSTGSWSVSESWPCGLSLEDLDLVLWSQTNGS